MLSLFRLVGPVVSSSVSICYRSPKPGVVGSSPAILPIKTRCYFKNIVIRRLALTSGKHAVSGNRKFAETPSNKLGAACRRSRHSHRPAHNRQPAIPWRGWHVVSLMAAARVSYGLMRHAVGRTDRQVAAAKPRRRLQHTAERVFALPFAQRKQRNAGRRLRRMLNFHGH